MEDDNTKFWDKVLREGLHPLDPLGDLSRAADLLSSTPRSPIRDEARVVSLLFRRLEQTVLDYDFGSVNTLVISLLCALAPFARIEHFLTPGLVESVFVLFLPDAATFDLSVAFLERLFARADIGRIFERLVMATVVNLANFTAPRAPLWRFLCRFLRRFSPEIEEMIDFDALEPSGLIPVFTRSYIFVIKSVYANPPAARHEECFWELWDAVLARYAAAPAPDAPVVRLFGDLLAEIRISLFLALPSAFDAAAGEFASATAPAAWRRMRALAPAAADALAESGADEAAARAAHAALQ